MRRLGLIAAVVAAGCVALLAGGAGADDARTYRVEMLNAFGVYEGSDVRIAGVRAGSVSSIEINEAKRAVATIELSGPMATLGERTRCETAPQSLIAEYFIDCDPRGAPMPEGATIPASRVEQTVQTDLLFNVFRESYRERAWLVVNELGTAMAANPENLNQAIRLSVPALSELREVTGILARQRRELDRLNVGAERVISKLAERRADVVAAVAEGRDAAEAAASRRGDLTTDADRLDDFIGELRPTLAELGETARAGTPLLASLRAAAPDLDELGARLPAFNEAGAGAVVALGRAAVPGRRALTRGRDEIRDLARAGRKAPATSEILADLVRDLDDPRRAVEEDARAARSCDDRTRPCWATGRRAPTGYTGLEALLSYVYYQSGAINQFDSVGHFLHFNLFDVGAGPCGGFNAGPTVPARGGGRTTEITEVDPCVAWLGPNQPDVSFDLGLPRYDDSVCPEGSDATELCDPSISTHGGDGRLPAASGRGAAATGGAPVADPAAPAAPGAGGGALPGPGPGGQAGLEDLLGIGGSVGGGEGPGTLPGDLADPQAANELLDFLYGN